MDNIASYSETFIEQDASPQMKQFVPIQYELTAKFYPEMVKEQCLNKCSNNGDCTIDEEKSGLPFCKCLRDHVGADCSLTSLNLPINEDYSMKLFQGSSILLKA